MEKLAGIVLIIGCLMFVVAAFSPITIKVITASDPQTRAESIQNERAAWIFANLLFGAGSIIAVVGLALFEAHVQNIGDNSSIKWVSYLLPITAALGTLFWVIISYNRIALSPQELANNLSGANWMFPAYTILLQITLMIVGFVLILSDYPAWLSWGMLGLGGLSLVAYLLFKDMPPFAHYVPLLIMGIALLR